MSGPEPTREQPGPQLSTAPATGRRRIWPSRRVPGHIGRARTSTVVLAVLFVAFFALWIGVRPVTTSSTVVPATTDTSVIAPVPAPATTAEPTTSSAPTTSESPTTTSRSTTTTTGTTSRTPTTGGTTTTDPDTGTTEEAPATETVEPSTTEAPATTQTPPTS